MEQKIDNLNVVTEETLITPKQLKEKIPMTQNAKQTVLSARKTVENILDKKDHRLLVVVGPCSIHHIEAAKDYAQRLLKLAKEVEDTLFVVMRVYFEKPRTTVGWKGLINDPYLNDTFQIEDGLEIARELLVSLTDSGLPLANEALDPISPQYLQECFSWSAIGARTTESQTHREMASGLSCPVGFKNGTDGGFEVVVNALQSVVHPHNFLGVSGDGNVAIIRTTGNKYGHVVLRGGAGKPNYDAASVERCEKTLAKNNLEERIVIDCSHANSNKDAGLQPLVFKNIVDQIVNGNKSIMGVMIESNINWGNQKLVKKEDLKYGVSITDACVDWAKTEEMLREARESLKEILPTRNK